MLKPVYMSDPKFDIIVNRIIESYPNACVLYIDEIVNPELQKAYESRKESIRASRGHVSEVSFFHGTHEKFISTISSNGFDPTLNKRAAFGYGVYFAKNAKYSSDYMLVNAPDNHAFMFVCDVLVGNTATGGRKDDPNIDNNVDNKRDPSIITTVYPDGAYPRYVVAFYKNARG